MIHALRRVSVHCSIVVLLVLARPGVGRRQAGWDFRDHMVLQQKMPVPVWARPIAGER